MEEESKYTIVIFGKTGHGKSSILNKLCGVPETFREGEDLESTTEEVESKYLKLINSEEICQMIDTPGFYDTKNRDNANAKAVTQFLTNVKNGFNLILFAYSLQEVKFDISLQVSMRLLQTLFGEEVYQYSRLVFTQIDCLNPKIQDKKLQQIKTELPELLLKQGFNIPNKQYVFQYEEDDGGLSELVEEIKKTKKYKPNILQEINKLDLNLNDPVAVLKHLSENSRQMQEFMFQRENMVTMINNYQKQLDQFEEEKKVYRKQIENLMKEQNKLQEESLKTSKENQKELQNIMKISQEKMLELQKKHEEHVEKMRENWQREQEIKEKQHDKELEYFRKEVKSLNKKQTAQRFDPPKDDRLCNLL